MATQQEMEFAYSLIDRMFRLSLGENADFSGAKYDGDFSLRLEDAQRRKHEFVVRQLGIRPGSGVTLSTAQAEACRRNGLTVHVMDGRTVTPATFGRFDAVVSLGAWEHF